MSIEIQAKLICDGCGKVLLSDIEHRSSHAQSIGLTLRCEAEHQHGWRTIRRGRYNTPTHYCSECLDRPMKPVPRKVSTNVAKKTESELAESLYGLLLEANDDGITRKGVDRAIGALRLAGYDVQRLGAPA